MIYKCRSPFMSRVGQFEEGEQTLVCGVLEDVALKVDGYFYMTLGTSPTMYRISSEKLKDVRHTLWTNPQGKKVWIIPVSEFETKKDNE